MIKIKIYIINMSKNKIINITYDIKRKDKEEGYIKIFGENFVKNNKNKCKMIIDDKEKELIEEYNIENYSKDKLELKLKVINNLTDISFMFDGCSSLSNLSGISNWDINKVTNLSFMFSECSSLTNLPDISKWDTKNVTNINGMFFGCNNLINFNLSKFIKFDYN